MGISISSDLKKTIDDVRGDIPRSRYISKILRQQIICQLEEVNRTNNALCNGSGGRHPKSGDNSASEGALNE